LIPLTTPSKLMFRETVMSQRRVQSGTDPTEKC
jgi:hypothetical protein